MWRLILTSALAVALTSWGDARAADWEYAPSLKIQREMHAVAKDGNGFIYAIGGSTQYPWDVTPTVERFDEGGGDESEWSLIADLDEPHGQPCAATDIYGRVYAIGGTNGDEYLARVERYNDSVSEWEDVAEMQEPHVGAAATTDSDGLIWVIGGGTHNNKVELYNPDTDTWEYGPDLPSPRQAHAAVTDCEGRIYVIGGTSESGPSLCDVLRYDPAQPELGWTPIAPMPTCRQWLAAVVDCSCNIWTIGGSGSGWVTGKVEIYDPETGEWSDGPSLQQPRNALGAVLSDLGYIYAVGGGTWTNPLNVVERILVCDCNTNGIADQCDIDCGEPGGPCDIPSCGQSEDCNSNGVPDECDIADGTSPDEDGNGIPDECEDVSLDIKPGSCPNPLNHRSYGVLPLALVAGAGFDVSDIDLATIQLSRADGAGGSVVPLEGPPGPHSVIADVATPFDGEPCDCHELEGDGVLDLSMKFATQEVVEALLLNELPSGAEVELVVTGMLLDGIPFEASDCITIVSPRPEQMLGIRSAFAPINP